MLIFGDGERDVALDPATLDRLVRFMDPGATTVWRDQVSNPWERHKAEHMGVPGTFMLPRRPYTLALGKGAVKGHWGLDATLGGARAAYGKDAGSQVIGGGKLQWHIDGGMWDSRGLAGGGGSGLPCRAVSMRCIEAPPAHPLITMDYGDGTQLKCPLGSTLFISGCNAYDVLSEEEQEFVFLLAFVCGDTCTPATRRARRRHAEHASDKKARTRGC